MALASVLDIHLRAPLRVDARVVASVLVGLLTALVLVVVRLRLLVCVHYSSTTDWQHRARVLLRRRVLMDRAWTAALSDKQARAETAELPPAYILYVLGSGGHTAELCEMAKQQFRPAPGSHRRYLVTSGDTHSRHAVRRLEALFSVCGRDAGTHDIVEVVRARQVHQPLWTAWFSALLSAQSIVRALTSGPKGKGQTHPNLIVTNGPGTGFVVCVVAFALRLLGLVPADRATVLFLETWAHVATLSLTGRLFRWTHLADLFIVQHAPLAATTGARFVGDVARHGNLLGIRKALATVSPPTAA